MGPSDIFEAVIYTRWPCPTPSGFRGPSVCRDRAPIVARADFYERVDKLQREKQFSPPATVGRKEEKIKVYFFPTAAVRGYI